MLLLSEVSRLCCSALKYTAWQMLIFHVIELKLCSYSYFENQGIKRIR